MPSTRSAACQRYIGESRYQTSTPAASRCAPSLAAAGRPFRSSTNEMAATATARPSANHSSALPNGAAAAMPTRTAMPPVRGTGCSCSERSFGRSSAKRAKRVSNSRTAMNASTNDTAPATPCMARILASRWFRAGRRAVPAHRLGDAGPGSERWPPPKAFARPRGINDERVHQPPHLRAHAGERAAEPKKRDRYADQASICAERPADFRDELRRAEIVAIGGQESLPSGNGGTGCSDHQLGEITDVDQAPAVLDRAQRKWPAALDQSNEPQKICSHTRPVNERRGEGGPVRVSSYFSPSTPPTS